MSELPVVVVVVVVCRCSVVVPSR